MNQQQKESTICFRKSYLAAINNAVGSRMFASFFLEIDGVEQEVLAAGESTCAYFVPFVLKGFDLTQSLHLTVDGTRRDLLEFGWRVVDQEEMFPGAILTWEPKEFAEEPHRHIGVYVGDNQAVSASAQEKTVVRHVVDRGGRRLEAVLARDIPQYKEQ